MSKNLGFFAAAALALSVLGCQKVDTTTQVRGDSSFTRTLKVSVQSPMGDAKVADAVQLLGDGWKSKVEKPESTDQPGSGGETLTATRERVAGSDGDDFVLKSQGKDQVRCHVSSRLRPDGDIEYLETYTWVGDQPKESAAGTFVKEKAQVEKVVNDALAPLSPTKQQVDDVVSEFGDEAIYAIFGPSQPLLVEFMTAPELALHHVKSKLFVQLTSFLRKEFPNADQATVESCARKLVTSGFDEDQAKKIDKATKPDAKSSDSGDSDMAIINSTVSIPGQVVETNGEPDAFDGKVYWSMYSVAAAAKPVTLRLVVKP